jgi:tRNA-specific 2-thiouridylase
MKVLVAMSGGVDSSTAAALLVEAGHEVVGVGMKTHTAAGAHARACCTADDMNDARAVAQALGIRFYTLNYTDVFRDEVIIPFAQSYAAGETPNPCIVCNDRVKFRPLLQRARDRGAKLATGHYARNHEGLVRAADRTKDQSYFLYRLRRDQLCDILFPLGEMHKDEVRAQARRLGLRVAEKSESQDICFVQDGHGATVEAILPEVRRSGAVIDEDGHRLGSHRGVHHFTLGQRRGVSVSSPEPRYVSRIDAATGAITLGRRESLLCQAVEIQDTTWIDTPSERCTVQQRYRSRPTPCRVEPLSGGRARIHFDYPEPRGAPGQAAVVYRGDRVLGGGVLCA